MTRRNSTSPIDRLVRPARAAPPARTKPAAPPVKTAAKATVRSAAAIEAASPAPQKASKTKAKLVRDSFTIPKVEYDVLAELKMRAILLAHPAKKSELLRVGIAVLNAMSDKAFLAALGTVPSLKTGRPKKDASAARASG